MSRPVACRLHGTASLHAGPDWLFPGRSMNGTDVAADCYTRTGWCVEVHATKQQVGSRHTRERCVVIKPRLSPGTDAVDEVGAAQKQLLTRNRGCGPEEAFHRVAT